MVNLVGEGEAWIGLTDSDDVAAAQREGLPVAALPLTADLLWIPNSVAVVRNSPHPAGAQQLFEYLRRRDVVEKLITAKALEGFSANEVSASCLKVNWDELLRQLDGATTALEGIFLR